MAMKKDYKNAPWIVELFTHCITKGNTYLKAKELDDDQNMHLALMDFGKDLGSLSEITVRHLLYKYDKYEECDGEGDKFYSLWRRLCGGSLQPQLKQLGFSCDSERKSKIERKDIRDHMSNQPKHQARLADSGDWLDFLDVYQELRKLIRNFVINEKTAPIEFLHTQIGDSEEEELGYLFGSARGFHKDSGYKYILITDRSQCKTLWTYSRYLGRLFWILMLKPISPAGCITGFSTPRWTSLSSVTAWATG